MNLSFSTRGWPKLSWDEMVDTALDMGFAGIEVYNLHKFESMLAKGGAFHQYQTAATARDLREKKLTVPCFDTSLDLSSDLSAVQTLTELIEVILQSEGGFHDLLFKLFGFLLVICRFCFFDKGEHVAHAEYS